jgi:hypothetical protein
MLFSQKKNFNQCAEFEKLRIFIVIKSNNHEITSSSQLTMSWTRNIDKNRIENGIGYKTRIDRNRRENGIRCRKHINRSRIENGIE